jgi:hypothetical protein
MLRQSYFCRLVSLPNRTPNPKGALVRPFGTTAWRLLGIEAGVSSAIWLILHICSSQLTLDLGIRCSTLPARDGDLSRRSPCIVARTSDNLISVRVRRLIGIRDGLVPCSAAT